MEKENSSKIIAEQEYEEKSVEVPKSNENVPLARNIMVKSPPLMDISNESTEDYNEKSMEEPSGSQVHGENGNHTYKFSLQYNNFCGNFYNINSPADFMYWKNIRNF